jgi:hypothetical protein
MSVEFFEEEDSEPLTPEEKATLDELARRRDDVDRQLEALEEWG